MFHLYLEKVQLIYYVKYCVFYTVFFFFFNYTKYKGFHMQNVGGKKINKKNSNKNRHRRRCRDAEVVLLVCEE